MTKRISSRRKEALAQLCQQFQVDILYIFGSRAGEVKAWLDGEINSLSPGPSDVDVGVKTVVNAPFSIVEKVQLAIALENMFDVNRIDLVSLHDVDSFLAANIIRGERVYAGDEYRADEFDLYILRRAGDLAPLERERMALILGETK